MVLAFAYSGRYNTRPVVNVSTQPRHGRAWAEVNLANLLANARTVQRAAGGSPLLPMVKASAYGLGAVRVARALETLDPWGFGVGTVEEGVELRTAGISRPFVVFTPAVAAQQRAYAEHDLIATIDDPAVAAAWRLPYHIEIDTGMGRCGLRYDDARLETIATTKLEGVFTHLAAADSQPDTVAWQWGRFQSAVARIGKKEILLHAANSAGAWRLARRLDLVRPGIFLFGGSCGPDLPQPLPVVSVRARVVSLRQLPPGEPVSYGGEWRATRETAIATVGIGYADGFPWSTRGRAAVLLAGRRYPVVGRVTMDFIMIDLGSPTHSVSVGDVVTVIGEDRGDAITLDEFAQWSGTISYEILTGMGARLSREYIEG
jgi:alanine racemase